MPLQDAFLSPAWVATAAVAVPLVLLYLIRPDPSRVRLPTFRFLAEEERQRATSPILERLSRSLLLVLQVLVVLLVATSLASPYVTVEEREVVEETVLVVDTSASMATTAEGTSRFERAVATASEEVTETTSVVTTAGGGEVRLRRAPPSDVEDALAGLAVTDAPGDLRSAAAQARALAGEDARIVVLSDFAGAAWSDAVATTRARGLRVDLRQFDRGGAGNVGFVDRRFTGSEVRLSVKNFGADTVERTVELGGEQATLSLGPGDVGSVTLPVPAGGAEATLSPGDDFATDDRVSVAAPEDPTVDVLVLTNDRNQYLTTALSVADQIDLTVDNPPTTVEDEYDVIVYSNVDADSLLPGNVAAGQDLLADGGGVAVQAQTDLPDYGGLSLVDPTGTASTPTIQRTAETPLTRDIDFQPPEEYLTGSLREGRTLVELRDGTPLLATAERDGGRLLYYGYLEERSSFKFNYQYPVFWKRAAFYLAGRQPLPDLNHATGETARFESESVSAGDQEITAAVDSTGGGRDVDEDRQFPETGDTGNSGAGGVDSQQAGFSAPDRVEEAELVREYNRRIREETEETD